MNPAMKNTLLDALDKYKESKGRWSEIQKFKDSRRKEIYESVQLTDTQKKKLMSFT